MTVRANETEAVTPIYSESRDLPYAPEPLFDLVADVERYPEYVPTWLAARVIWIAPNVYETEQTVQIAVVRMRFRTRSTLVRPRRIEVRGLKGPFRPMQIGWDFVPLDSGGCRVALTVDFEVRSTTLRHLAGTLSSDLFDKVIAAFESRADQLFAAAPAPDDPEQS